jgi:hypothetical protein
MPYHRYILKASGYPVDNATLICKPYEKTDLPIPIWKKEELEKINQTQDVTVFLDATQTTFPSMAIINKLFPALSTPNLTNEYSGSSNKRETYEKNT